jgi:hypothetical protein
VKTAAVASQVAFGKLAVPVRAAFRRPEALWLLPGRVEQTRVGLPSAFAAAIPASGILSLHDCRKHRFRFAACGL